MRTELGIDAAVRQAAEDVMANWPEARAQAVLGVLGLVGREPETLLDAAASAGISRESVRRDRDRTLTRLAMDGRATWAATRMVDFLERHGGELDSAVAATCAHQEGLLSAPGTLARTWHVLALARLLPAARSDGTLVLADGAAGRLRDDLADGLPHAMPGGLAHDDPTLGALVEAQIVRVLKRGATRWVARTDLPEAPAVRELRRLLTLTGPLPWADLLAAWSRAKGRKPYGTLPSDVAVLAWWVEHVRGVSVRVTPDGQSLLEAGDPPAELSKVDDFLVQALRAAPAGLERAELLSAAHTAGLAPSSVSGVLTYHPALVSARRGRWTLRTSPERVTVPATMSVPAPRRPRTRPTTYTWSPAGELVLEISVPTGPSPVVAVPAAVAGLLEDLQLTVDDPSGAGTVAVRNARAWGFSPAFAALSAQPGDRVTLTCDLVAHAATIRRSEKD